MARRPLSPTPQAPQVPARMPQDAPAVPPVAPGAPPGTQPPQVPKVVPGVASVGAYVDGLHVVLLHREPDGTLGHRKVKAQYTSYHTREDFALCESDVMEQLRRSRAVVGVVEEGEWVRVTWRDWDTRDKGISWLAQENVKAYEADVNPVRRYFADTGALTSPAPRVCYLDIETDSRVSFANKEEMRLLCWTVKDAQGNTARGMLDEDTDRDEARLLRELWNALEPYDVVAAWYGDGFDFPVVHARTKARRLLVNVRRWRWLDQLEVYKGLNAHVAESGDEKRSMSLQSVAMALLGIGKLDFDASGTWDAWAAGGERRAKLLEYNEHDVTLQVGIEAKTQYIKLFAVLCAACRLFVETHSLHASTQMDGYMLRLGKLRGHHFPTKPGRDSIRHHEKFKGAYVMAPKTHGIAKDVHVADFAGLYPSIMISWNMSPETYIGGIPEEATCICPLTNSRFAVDRPGILTDALLELRALRKEWVDKKASLPPGTDEWHDADRWSTAFKVLANSFYGVTGLSYGRFYNPRISEGVTQNGAWLIRETIKEAESRGMRAVYCDTDSVFVEGATREGFEDFVRWCNAELYPRLLKHAGCKTNCISLAYEKQFERVVFCAAKKYIGRYRHYKGKEAQEDSKPEVRGMEFKRGDSVLLGGKLQGELIELLMRKRCEDTEAVREVVRRHLKHAMEDALELDEVVLSQALQKPLTGLDAYEGPNEKGVDSSPPHVRVARILAERGQDVSVGTKVAFVITDASVSPMRVIPAADWNGEVDRWGIWEQRIWPPTQRLLVAAFPDADWSEFDKVRPKEARGKRGAPKGDAPQLGLFTRKGSVLDLEARESNGFDERCVKAVRAILELAPEGNTLVRLKLVLAQGEVTMDLDRHIDPQGDVVRRLRCLLGPKAVSVI